MSQPHIDYVIKGEGDYALPELCEHLRNEDVFSMGIEYVSCNKAGLVNAKLPPQKLDELPDPDRDILYKYEHNKNNIFLVELIGLYHKQVRCGWKENY